MRSRAVVTVVLSHAVLRLNLFIWLCSKKLKTYLPNATLFPVYLPNDTNWTLKPASVHTKKPGPQNKRSQPILVEDSDDDQPENIFMCPVKKKAKLNQ